MKRFLIILVALCLITSCASALWSKRMEAPLDEFLERFDAFDLPGSKGHSNTPSKGIFSDVLLQCGDHLSARVNCTDRSGPWTVYEISISTDDDSAVLGVFYLADVMLQCFDPDMTEETRYRLLGEVAAKRGQPDSTSGGSSTDTITLTSFDVLGNFYINIEARWLD